MKVLTYCKIHGKTDPDRLLQVLDCREYIDSVKQRKSRASVNESCTAVFLLAKTLEYVLKENTSQLKYRKDSLGRPYIEGREDIRFSLSHSGEYAVCAVSTEGNVGVDIEKIPTDKRYVRIKERFFSKKEKERAGESGTGFAGVWTRKESYYKYKEGKTYELDTENDESVSYDTFDIGGEYTVTVCRRREETAFSELTEIKTEEN